jgi:hypothetical protein
MTTAIGEVQTNVRQIQFFISVWEQTQQQWLDECRETVLQEWKTNLNPMYQPRLWSCPLED